MKSFVAGKYVNEGSYKSFHPELINREWQLEDMEVIHLLSKADREVGRLDMHSEYVPNIELFISMHVVKEATKSSKIEGTKTNIEEVILEEAEIPSDKRDDWVEVQNYIHAMETSVDSLKALPFSSRLIKEAHAILLKGVRGKKRSPGEFRKSQNWIGGASLDDALFIPPVHTQIPDLMSDLEKFVHNSEIRLPELLKIALVHYQFETIHPFLDGNGRVGRLIITLYLVSKGILKRPVLYLSDFFERNRSDYFSNLMYVREKNEISHWFKFFLVGVVETAQKGISTFDQIMKLQRVTSEKVQSLGARAANGRKVVERLYERPMINAIQVQQCTGLSKPASYQLIEKLEGLGILTEITAAKRGRIYVFREYLQLYA